MKNKIKLIFFLIFFLIIINIFQIIGLASDKVIVLDPGHGGKDPGSINSNLQITERDINLKIAKYLKEYLSEYSGITVLLTHDGFSEGKYELIDRAIFARKNNADLLISLHCNSSDSGRLNGTEAFVTANKSLPKYNEQCSKLAEIILENISKLGITNRGVKTKLSGDSSEVYSDGTRGDYYGIIRYAMKGIKEGIGANIQNGEGLSTVLIEHCYINGEDAKYLDSEEDIKKLAQADCNAIVEFYNLRLKSEFVSGVSLDKKSLELKKGQTEKLLPSIMPETAINKKIKWTSSNEAVATVNNQGEVTAISAGETTITVETEDGGYKATCYVKVLGIEVLKNEIYLLKDENYQFEYNDNNVELEIKIEDETIASIDEQGIIKGLKEGITKLIISSLIDTELNEEIIINVSELKENQYIKINNIKIENEYLSKINEKISKEDFINNFEISSDLEVQINNNDKEFITTNTIIDIIDKENKNIIKRYYCLIYGDLNEDGKISALDYTQIKNHIMDVKKISGMISKNIADVNRDGKISALDYTQIKNHIMDVKKIELR